MHQLMLMFAGYLQFISKMVLIDIGERIALSMNFFTNIVITSHVYLNPL